jgi:hypothetical protein
MSSEPDKDFVEVTWGGKKLLLKESQLDEWYHNKSFEEKVDFVNQHPWIKQPVGVHKFNNTKFNKDEDLMDPSDYVLVRWSGDRVLLLERNQLDTWYDQSFEMHQEYVRRHPDCVLDNNDS